MLLFLAVSEIGGSGVKVVASRDPANTSVAA
jgi:hypothetical protein